MVMAGRKTASPLLSRMIFLLVQPQQGAIEQLGRYRFFGLENQVGLQRRQ
jgi:hypothetical protein